MLGIGENFFAVSYDFATCCELNLDAGTIRLRFVKQAACLEKHPRSLESGLEVLPWQDFLKSYGPVASVFENIIRLQKVDRHHN